MCVLCLSAPGLLSLHREADLRDKFVRIVRFVGGYVVDIEHAAVRFIAVFRDPGGYGGDHEEKIMEPTNEMYTITARVINVQRNRCRIAMDGVECGAVLTGKLLYRAEYPVVGDYVTVESSDGAWDARITAILPRKSCITRPDRGGHGDSYVKTMGEQVMAANVDLCFLVTSMNADYSVNRIARYASAVPPWRRETDRGTDQGGSLPGHGGMPRIGSSSMWTAYFSSTRPECANLAYATWRTGSARPLPPSRLLPPIADSATVHTPVNRAARSDRLWQTARCPRNSLRRTDPYRRKTNGHTRKRQKRWWTSQNPAGSTKTGGDGCAHTIFRKTA